MAGMFEMLNLTNHLLFNIRYDGSCQGDQILYFFMSSLNIFSFSDDQYLQSSWIKTEE